MSACAAAPLTDLNHEALDPQVRSNELTEWMKTVSNNQVFVIRRHGMALQYLDLSQLDQSLHSPSVALSSTRGIACSAGPLPCSAGPWERTYVGTISLHVAQVQMQVGQVPTSAQAPKISFARS